MVKLKEVTNRDDAGYSAQVEIYADVGCLISGKETKAKEGQPLRKNKNSKQLAPRRNDGALMLNQN
jgi:hypothetical protein